MVDLRTSAAQLIAHPLVPVPPVEGVVARARHYRAQRLRRQMGASVLVVALALTAVVRAGLGGGEPDSLRLVDDPRPDATTTGARAGQGPTTTLGPDHPAFLPWSGRDFNGEWSRLRARKAGCSDRVDPALTPVKVMARDAGLTGQQPDEHEPFDQVQHLAKVHNDWLGGICGRAIELVDGALNEAVPADVVAVVGMPLDRDFDAAIAAGVPDKLGLPVVGGDGLAEVQHRSPFVYPVGTSAAALTRTAVEQARAAGARSFAVVYDGSHPFSAESADSFRRYVGTFGGNLRAAVDIGLAAGGPGGGSSRFREACGNDGCDLVFLALLPDAAATWFQLRPPAGRMETAGLPTLLTGKFPESCFQRSDDRCNGLVAWSGLMPWFGHDADRLDQAAERRTAIQKGSAMVESAMVGASVLFDALRAVDTGITRASLRAVLDSRSFKPYPVAPPLAWGPVPRAGNPVSQRWRLDTDTMATWAQRGAAWADDGIVTPWSNAVATWPPSMRAWAGYVTGEWPGATKSWSADARATWPEAAADWLDDVRRRWSTDTRRWFEEQVAAWSAKAGTEPPSGTTADTIIWLGQTASAWTGELLALSAPPPPWPEWLAGPPGPGAPETARAEPPGTDTPLPKQRWTATGPGWRTDPG